jgi:hypothetical protein
MRILLRTLTLVLLAVALSGCGVRTAYNNLDRLLLRWVDRQVSLDAEQTEVARSMIRQHIDWHCASELPDYAAWLRRIEGDVEERTLSRGALEAHAGTLGEFWQRMLTELRPSMIEVIGMLDDGQVQQLAESFEERNLELAERAELDDQAWREERVRGMERGLRRFIGRVDGDQRQRLERWAEELVRSDESTLEETLRWQGRFFDLLEHRDGSGFETELVGLLKPDDNWSESHRALMAHNRDRTLAALVDVLDLAGERQRNRLRSRLDSLATDFERLSCA